MMLSAIVCDAMIAGLTGLLLYIIIADFKRRARMTPDQRREEDRLEDEYGMSDYW